jgi:predicted phage terminase large subunit-like protein
LTKWFSAEAKEIYESPCFKKLFPRSPQLSDTQNTKDHWQNKLWWSYYATGAWWPITGKRANILIIDDPIKPDEAAHSDTKRININHWFDNTIVSRLRDPSKDAIIIIMQRTHDDDLCGHLIQKMNDGSWEEYTVLSLAAETEEYAKYETRYWDFELFPGEPLSPQRFPIESLRMLEKSYWPVNYNCQYQQDPIAKWSQEFHEEWFKYYDWIPEARGRIFTTVDPAFSKKVRSDDSVITTVKFIEDKCYILEQTWGKFDPAELEDNIIYHAKKWNPETIWVESIAAQVTISFSLTRRLIKEWLQRIEIEEIRQREDKWAKLRALIPLYRNWLIFHRRWDSDKLETQLLKFPRGKHDDYPDSLQLALHLYKLRPGMQNKYKIPKVNFNKFWMPVLR